MTLLTISEVAKRLSVSAKTVRLLIDDGQLVAVNVSAGQTQRRHRVDEAEVNRFIAARSTAVPA